MRVEFGLCRDCEQADRGMLLLCQRRNPQTKFVATELSYMEFG